MAESPEAFPPAVDPSERLGLGIHTRYGVTVKPSPKLQELIMPFIRPEAVRRHFGNSVLRFGISNRPVEVVQSYRSNSSTVARISSYEKNTSKYNKINGHQFRLPKDGLIYNQTLDKNGAYTSISLLLDASDAVLGDILRPPFFDDADQELRARITLPTEYVVPNAIEQAEKLQSAMKAEYPNARDELANTKLYFYNLAVFRREIIQTPPRGIIKPGDDA